MHHHEIEAPQLLLKIIDVARHLRLQRGSSLLRRQAEYTQYKEKNLSKDSWLSIPIAMITHLTSQK
jgi:hypothetical protein